MIVQKSLIRIFKYFLGSPKPKKVVLRRCGVCISVARPLDRLDHGIRFDQTHAKLLLFLSQNVDKRNYFENV